MADYFWFDNNDVVGIIKVAGRSNRSVQGQVKWTEHQGELDWISTDITSISYRYLIYDGTEDEWNWAEYLGNLMDRTDFREYMRKHSRS